ncbi:CorA family divalent cation transporter [Nocardia arthritidis]|uniref:CorA family divalent cation transporter n=1 Tax=Nocardia arthritidis TaxID=228602 RepID=UPI0007A4F2B5|nr:CorA family divalent cation transporter [Nocardia arthritidis]
MTTFLSTVAADHFDTEVLQQHWIPLAAHDADTAAVLRERLGLDFTVARRQVWESDNFLYLPVVAGYQRGETIEHATIVFALGGEFLVTLQPSEHFVPFDKAVAKMRRSPQLAGSAHGVMYALLWALNEASERVLHHAGDALEAIHEKIEQALERQDRSGTGIADLRDAVSRLDATARIVARTRETQLQLARTARHLMADADSGPGKLNDSIGLLLADIDGVNEHAGVEYDKARYLQQSVTTCLGARQNEVVKVFTVVTAAFLPSTLIAGCYGTDLIGVSEFSWQLGLLITALLALVAAVIPLAYLRKKGLLR